MRLFLEQLTVMESPSSIVLLLLWYSLPCRCDMIDCFGAAAMRDATPRDALHHSFTWDLSQNVTRAPFRSATVGVCGCVTPGGELILPHKGRTLMGYEKLLLQGIPFSRLLLGPETEVQ